MKIRFDYKTFGSDDVSDLDGRMMLGRVEFMFVKKNGEIRHAIGTRNLNDPKVSWGLLPMNVRVASEKVLTFIDLEKNAWRCLRRNSLIYYSDVVDIPD